MLITCGRCNTHVEVLDKNPGDIIQCRCGLGLMVPEIPGSAGKMNCPACGAPVDPDLKTCGFCDTRLATVICPSCFGVVFEKAKHCVHCGAVLKAQKVIRHGDSTRHECPRCPEHPCLQVEVVTGFPIERCSECEGVWIDQHMVEQIYKDREKNSSIQSGLATRGHSQEGKSPRISQGPEAYIKCPECLKLMNRFNFGRFSGVIIDTCKGHGTWFDADELRRILDFISSGGLEKQAQREKEELKEELRWLRRKANLDGTREAMQVRQSPAGRLLGGGSALAIGGILRKLF
jgi:Zn-finger nucleic acid-binding protein